MPPLCPFSFLCVSVHTLTPSLSLVSPPRRFSELPQPPRTVNTDDVGPSRSREPSRAFSILSPSPSLSSAESPINSRHRGYSDRAAKICGARGAVNKCAISLREIMHGSHLSKHLRQLSSCCEILDHPSLYLQIYM